MNDFFSLKKAEIEFFTSNSNIKYTTTNLSLSLKYSFIFFYYRNKLLCFSLLSSLSLRISSVF